MTVWTSYMPNPAETAHPTTSAAIGAHSRTAGDPRSTSPATTASETTATTGDANEGVPSGTSSSMVKIIGITVAAISMITDPATTGVKIRRSSDSLADSRNWNSADTTIRLAISAGPPFTIAAMQTAKKAPVVPMMRMCPEPIRPTRTACSTVVRPLMNSAAKASQARYPPEATTARITIRTPITIGANVTTASCTPSPTVTAPGGTSSGSYRTPAFTCAATKTHA